MQFLKETEFLAENEIPLSDFFSYRKLTVQMYRILFSVTFTKKYSLKLAIVYLKLKIWMNTCKGVYFW